MPIDLSTSVGTITDLSQIYQLQWNHIPLNRLSLCCVGKQRTCGAWAKSELRPNSLWGLKQPKIRYLTGINGMYICADKYIYIYNYMYMYIYTRLYTYIVIYMYSHTDILPTKPAIWYLSCLKIRYPIPFHGKIIGFFPGRKYIIGYNIV